MTPNRMNLLGATLCVLAAVVCLLLAWTKVGYLLLVAAVVQLVFIFNRRTRKPRRKYKPVKYTNHEKN